MRSLIFAFLPLVLFTGISLSKLMTKSSTIKYTCRTEQGILLEASNDQITVKLPNGKETSYRKVVQKSAKDFRYFEGTNQNANAQKVELSIKKSPQNDTYQFTAVLGSEAYSGSAEAKTEGA